MKKSITSNLRPLLCAFYAFLIAIAAFWAMPRNARAGRLYVVNVPHATISGVVSEYDTTSGAVINADFITGLAHPSGLALSGNPLFVTDVAFAMVGAGTVGKYDATTGAAINDRFIKGLTKPFGLAVESAK